MNLLYFSPVAWQSYAQRPHYLIRHLIQTGCVDRVLWVDPYATRLPQLADLFRKRGADRLPGPFQLPGLQVLDPVAWPVEPLPGGSWINHIVNWKKIRNSLQEFSSVTDEKLIIGAGRPHALALWALDKFKSVASFYDAMDDFSAFYTGLSNISMESSERRMARNVSKVWCSSRAIQNRLQRFNTNTVYLPNAYDMTHLVPSTKCVRGKTEDLVIGYVGTIGDWFNWESVVRLARAEIRNQIQIVGPCFKNPPGLPENVLLHPACSHTDAIHRICDFDICLIPFKINRLTRSVDPIKYYEYRAMGKPILSTRFGTMSEHAKKGGVLFFEECNMQDCCARALSIRPNVGEVELFRQENDWSVRLDGIVKWIKSYYN